MSSSISHILSFLALPLEVRDMIYSYLAGQLDGWLKVWVLKSGWILQNLTHRFSILLVCRQIRREALNAFEKQTSCLKLRLAPPLPPQNSSYHEGIDMPDGLRGNIRTLCLELPLKETPVLGRVRRELEKLPKLQAVTFHRSRDAYGLIPALSSSMSRSKAKVMLELEQYWIRLAPGFVSRSMAVWALSVKSRMQVNMAAVCRYKLRTGQSNAFVNIMYLEAGIKLGLDIEPPDLSMGPHFKTFWTKWPSLSTFDFDALSADAKVIDKFDEDWAQDLSIAS